MMIVNNKTSEKQKRDENKPFLYDNVAMVS